MKYTYDNILYACVAFAFKNYDATKMLLSIIIYGHMESRNKKIQLKKKNKANHFNTSLVLFDLKSGTIDIL